MGEGVAGVAEPPTNNGEVFAVSFAFGSWESDPSAAAWDAARADDEPDVGGPAAVEALRDVGG